MEFIKHVSSKKALYATDRGFRVKRFSVGPVELNKEEKQLYKRYQYSAIQRQKEFDLSTTTFRRLIHSKCYYCGVEPKQVHNEMLYNGIDRLDNDQGYNIDNCLACCKVCNRGKGDMSSSEYTTHLTRIVTLVMPQFIAFQQGNLEEVQKLREKQLKEAGAFKLNI